MLTNLQTFIVITIIMYLYMYILVGLFIYVYMHYIICTEMCQQDWGLVTRFAVGFVGGKWEMAVKRGKPEISSCLNLT